MFFTVLHHPSFGLARLSFFLISSAIFLLNLCLPRSHREFLVFLFPSPSPPAFSCFLLVLNMPRWYALVAAIVPGFLSLVVLGRRCWDRDQRFAEPLPGLLRAPEGTCGSEPPSERRELIVGISLGHHRHRPLTDISRSTSLLLRQHASPTQGMHAAISPSRSPIPCPSQLLSCREHSPSTLMETVIW